MANTLKKIQTITVGSGGSSTIEFTSIPQTYTDLKLVLSVRNSVDSADGVIEFNGSSTNVGSRMIVGDGSNVASYIDTANYFAVSRSSYTASVFGNVEIYIPNYTSANYKSFSIDSAPENNATGTSLRMTWGLWSNSAAITSIKLTPGGSTPTWVQYSTATLYGVANANTTTGGSGKATGGNQVYTDGTYWYHIFRSDGTFTPSTALNVDYLVVAGGGGGGRASSAGQSYGGGGGGAGGFRSTVTATGGGGSLESALAVTAQAYSITVGGGGAGGVGSPGAEAVSGSNSVFSTITSTGGGYGSGSSGGAIGGSGGGGAYAGELGKAGTTNQGYAGGNAGAFTSGTSQGAGGGGGGAGAVGSNGTNGVGSGGAGGAGVATSISGSSVTYAVGGTGGSNSTDNNGSSASVNTGSGGIGGGINAGGNANGGNGGSGIVIIRYAA
jgi:hypothetical protein